MSLAARVFFRVVLYIPRFRQWRDNQIDCTFGAPPNETKLWGKLKKDCRLVARIRVAEARAIVKAVPVPIRIRNLPAVRPEKKFIITLVDRPVSLQAAKRCIESARAHGEEKHLEIMPAIDRFHSEAFFRQHGLTWNKRVSEGGGTDNLAGMGCFASHYSLWKRCMEYGEPIIILEHDVRFIRPVPPLRFRHVIILGEQYKGSVLGLGPEVYHRHNHLWGTHAYAITPEGAERLLRQAARELLPPVDWFMRKKHIDILACGPKAVSLKLQQTTSSIASLRRFRMDRQ